MTRQSYIQPAVTIVTTALQSMICAASGVTSTEPTIEYGGEDDGTHKPGVPPRRRSVWDYDDELNEE